MGEVLFWTVAVFAVLGGPPLLAVWSEMRRERREVEERERQRRFEKEQMRQREGGAGASSSTGLWPGTFVGVWIL